MMPPKKDDTIYSKSKPFSAGIVLIDVLKNEWVVGKKIGEGGFADVYTVQKPNASTKGEYVAKIEPKDNGPLFTEVNFFIKCLKPDMIKEWNKKSSFLGIPEYHGSGTYNLNGFEHRFLVTNRFGRDITTKLHKPNKEISLPHLSMFLQQIIDAFHFIHSKGYVHGDVKTENLLLNYDGDNKKSSNADKVYLIDYGLVRRSYDQEEIKVDKKTQNNGTLLFCSRDAHWGIATKRSDLESLAYAILSWFDYKLPWKTDKKPGIVNKKKDDFMKTVAPALSDQTEIPKQITDFLIYVNTLHHLQEPDYKYLKELFESMNKVDVKVTTAKCSKIPTKCKRTYSNGVAADDGDVKSLPEKRAKVKNEPIQNGAASDSKTASKRVTRSSAKV